ncbi:M48 family metallopeptidase [Noviherbaspirillum saxi]|nr:M48 family metallopeptidase [Noviherbaspirillum saxi]
MRHIVKAIVGLTFAATAVTASAQLPFSLPGLGKIGDKLGGINIGNTVSNLTKASREPDESEEVHIGQEFAATLLGAKPLVADPALQRYVNTLGRWLALQTERPDLPWTFGVLDDAGFNAFATPGGYIFVTRGLLARMRSEAELAGVLAHEIGHVLKKHHLRAVQKNAGMALLGDFVIAANKGGNTEARNALMNVGRKLYASGLDKEDEFEADRLGVVIAARAGYDAFGLPSVLQTLQAQNPGDGEFSLLFKTHPAPSARIDMLDRLMQDRFDSLPASQGQPLTVRLGEFRK